MSEYWRTQKQRLSKIYYDWWWLLLILFLIGAYTAQHKREIAMEKEKLRRIDEAVQAVGVKAFRRAQELERKKAEMQAQSNSTQDNDSD